MIQGRVAVFALADQVSLYIAFSLGLSSLEQPLGQARLILYGNL